MDNIEDIMFAQRLADNEKGIRDKAMRRVAKYIGSNPLGLTESSFMKLWKGLYYCMYMADKLLIQEDLAENTSLLLNHCTSFSQRMLFFKCALNTFAREWEGIDKFRINKFMMLVCRVLRQMLVHLRSANWNEEELEAVVTALETSVISPSDNANEKPLGLKFHLADIIMDELAKIGREDLPHRVIVAFVYPYIKVLMLSNIRNYIDRVKRFVIYWLIEQSDAVQGVEDEDSGQEEGTLDEEEEMAMSEGEEETEMEVKDGDGSDTGNESDISEEEIALDPRAGGVDVILPQLKPDYDKIASMFLALGSIQSLTNKRRKEIYRIVRDFRAVAQGIDPLSQIGQVNIDKKGERKCVTKALKKMKIYEKALMDDEEIGRSASKQKICNQLFASSPNQCQKRSFNEVEKNTGTSFAYHKSAKKRKITKKKINNKNVKKRQTENVKKRQTENVIKNDLTTEINLKMKTIAEKVDFPLGICEKIPENNFDVNKIKKRQRKRKNKKVTTNKNQQQASVMNDSIAPSNEAIIVADQTIKKKNSTVKKSKILKKNLIKLASLERVGENGSSNLTKVVEGKINDQPQKNNKKGTKLKRQELVPLAKKKKVAILSRTSISSVGESPMNKKRKKQLVQAKLKADNNLDENPKDHPNMVVNNLPKKHKLTPTSNGNQQIQNRDKLPKKKRDKNAKKPATISKISQGSMKQTAKNSQSHKKQSFDVSKNFQCPKKQPLKNSNQFQGPKTTNNSKKPLASKRVCLDPWKEPLKEGEVEIFIMKKKKKKKTGVSSAPSTPLSNRPAKRTPNSSGKTLAINLERNMEHDIHDYRRMLNSNPQIPFSSVKKPRGSVLKSRSPLQKPTKSPASAIAMLKTNSRRKINGKQNRRLSFS